jgi:hypothetical protein
MMGMLLITKKSNALSFLPIDALADTGEYTSRKIIELVS